MKFFQPTTLAACLLVSVLACNNKSANVSDKLPGISEIKLEDIKNEISAGEGNRAADTSRVSPQKQPGQPQAKTSETKTEWDKKIIKTASINLEVKNYKSFNGQLHESVKKYGGYIAQEEQNQTDYKIENTIAIKVPVDQFDDLVTILTNGDQKLLEKKISSEDVTTEMVDTKSRMEAKKQVRLRYLDLLRQAKSMEDILNVQNEINGIQEDIEAAAGRVAYLSHAAAYSTIHLTYAQVLDASAKDDGEGSYGTKLWSSFKNGWNWVGDVFVGIISIWPLFFFGFACWIAYKKWLASKVQKKTV